MRKTNFEIGSVLIENDGAVIPKRAAMSSKMLVFATDWLGLYSNILERIPREKLDLFLNHHSLFVIESNKVLLKDKNHTAGAVIGDGSPKQEKTLLPVLVMFVK